MKSIRTVSYVGAAFLAVAALVAFGLRHMQGISADAAVWEAAGRLLLANETAGRQALVSSIWWPPLHVLLRLPVLAVWTEPSLPLASLIVSAACGVGALWFIHDILRAWRLGITAWIGTLAVAAHPVFLAMCLDGSAGSTRLLLVLLTAFGAALWVSRRQVRFLVYFATGTALLMLADAHLALWAVAVFGLLTLDQLVWRRPWRQKEAVLILAALPGLYAAALWCLLSWLIMGDGLYFARSLGPDLHGLMRVPVDWAPPALAAAVLTGGVILAVIAARSRWPAAMLAVAALAFSLQTPREPEPTDASYADVLRDRARWTLRIERDVRNRTDYPRVFVCGYEALRLLGASPEPAFLHALDFRFDAAKRAYHSQDLFMLIHAPEGRSAMDSVHRRFPDIHALGHRATLYAGAYGAWRLYEIIQAPPRQRR